MSALAPTLQAFFTDRLIRQRGASAHTIAAYRDTWRLLLTYAADRAGRAPALLDLADLDAPLWQRRVAAVFQDFEHYPLSVRENIGFGAVEAAGDTDAVLDAARRAGALPVVEALDSGLDTVLTPARTGGTDLSGGQWQRVALARALFAVHGGARVLVLDEPAANLDVRAEAELYDRFLDLTKGLTTVVISHRFSTVRQADQIVVLDGGRVVEQGSHEQLLEAGGSYARMFVVQLSKLAGDGHG